jgi:epoxyqueuosine reductase
MTNLVHKHFASPSLELYRGLENKGHRARIVPIKRLSTLRQLVTEWREKNLLDKELFEEYLMDFVFDLPNNLLNAKSIVVVASPQPHRRISFILNKTTAPVLIPSNYSYETDAEVAKILDDYALSQNFRFAKAALPLKILAVCNGLAEYGKNNIAYIRGMGSYFRLSAFYSDLPPDTDIWLKPRMMERCRHCVSCLKNCPTQATCSERFLMYAERCITFHNERKRDFPFWLQPSWHNSLVGCLHCQQCCPENKANRDWIENSWVFSEEESSCIMNGEPIEKLPGAMAKKLEQLGMLTYYEILPRNLRALLAKKSLPSDRES